MKKKTYIAPISEMVELEICNMLCGSTPDVGVSNDVTDDDASMSAGHRGTWGNLWNKGE